MTRPGEPDNQLAESGAPPPAAGAQTGAVGGLERQIDLGFMFAHSLASEQSRQLFEVATSAFALGELLVEQGVIDGAALAERRRTIAAALGDEVKRSGLGLVLRDPGQLRQMLRVLAAMK